MTRDGCILHQRPPKSTILHTLHHKPICSRRASATINPSKHPDPPPTLHTEPCTTNLTTPTHLQHACVCHHLLAVKVYQGIELYAGPTRLLRVAVTRVEVVWTCTHTVTGLQRGGGGGSRKHRAECGSGCEGERGWREVEEDTQRTGSPDSSTLCYE